MSNVNNVLVFNISQICALNKYYFSDEYVHVNTDINLSWQYETFC